MSDLRKQFLSTVLDCIEQRESKLLVWGIVDGLFRRDELSDLIAPLIDSALEAGFEDFFESSDVISALSDLKWLVEVEQNNDEVGYRSRMAETVRLLQRLRQLFPKHARQINGWQEAPTLVADFRFQRRRRQYPKRNLTRTQALQCVKTVTDNQSILTGVKAILGSSNPEFLLSGFQVRATERILHAIESSKPLATIVCSGTGSGKTLAFYLPALASIVRHHLERDSLPWVKVVALYPRSELLKDQLCEVIRRVVQLKNNFLEVPIRIGAFYGDTPQDARWCKWKKRGQDYICPSLRCIHCKGEMTWHQADHEVGRERLKCHDCQWTIEGDVFPLTRKSLGDSVPDILFTTTEMLNQRLSDNRSNHLFGIGSGANRPPELILLDEVHTYEGRHGAQVAYLLRRWAHLVDHPLRFVGLSATLREATTFFASLTGTPQHSVLEISPRPDEIESEGAEYMIALRGDPVSRAALLSTTIQTTMLLQRCLDPKPVRLNHSLSQGAFGQRTFVFTDDLDVTNRLYFNLLSAEGRTSKGTPDMRNAPKGGLALLRVSGPSSSRYRGGQDWLMCEQLGHLLTERLDIKRVSSQDRGVDANADVVVATAALEVGFDDPTVGAVIQHKAPRSMAGFLQRKGRAGRTRGMRPWTAVVLSDYGRDRLIYQGYDLLFDPELPVRTLPLSNRYIARIQSVFASIDYLGLKLQDATGGSVWQDLSKPPQNNRRTRLIKELRLILESENATKNIENYLTRALKMPKEEVTALLWEFPRPLMTMVFPTALRRLISRWNSNGQPESDFQIHNNPLPDFVPGSLFADLNLAEVNIELPNNEKSSLDNNRNVMSVFAALKDFAPGRVSRRFGVHSRTERYWISPSSESLAGHSPSALDIDEFGKFVPLGKFSYWRDNTIIDVPVYMPMCLSPTPPDINISDTSTARLNWLSQFVPRGLPTWLEPPEGSIWNTLIVQLGFFTHARHSPIEVRRFAIESKAEIGVERGEKIPLTINFTHSGQNVALGAAYSGDGVVFQIRIPDDLAKGSDQGSEKWRALRTSRFFDMAWRGEALSNVPSPFLREWLAHVFLSSLTYEAIQEKISLHDAATRIISGDASISLSQVLAVLFQSSAMQSVDDCVLISHDRLRQDLDALIVQPAILEELYALAELLWEPISHDWTSWLRKIYQSTLGCALLKTIGDLCPAINLDDLSLDLDRGPSLHNHLAPFDAQLAEIWITEKCPGGSGLIEEFMRNYAEDPRRFFSMVRATMEMGEFELIDYQLVNLLKLLTSGNNDSETLRVVNSMRIVTNHDQLTQDSRHLRHALLQEGFSPFHGFLVSVGNRILRPGTGSATDGYLAKAIQNWRSEEERLGIEIDLRVICYWLSQFPDIDSIVNEPGIPTGGDRRAWRISAIYGLLWARGRTIRQSPLQTWNPFYELPPVERLLVIDNMHDERERVSVDSPEWMEDATILLAKGRLVTLTCREENRATLGSALHALITNPVDTGYLRAYARLQGVRQTNSFFEADIELLEAVQ
ncbi:DEAD/DEAH box helicase [Candidatus Parcubacteria bacterium]|nr:MAG: DEAD/DEAH box helicase [Candidatus Parcubacteria bacterium]